MSDQLFNRRDLIAYFIVAAIGALTNLLVATILQEWLSNFLYVGSICRLLDFVYSRLFFNETFCIQCEKHDTNQAADCQVYARFDLVLSHYGLWVCVFVWHFQTMPRNIYFPYSLFGEGS